MNFDSILSQGRTHCGTSVNSKKRLLEQVAQFISEDDSNYDQGELFNDLLARERLGSTGIGHGVAIPHCRSSRCQRITGILLKLDKAIEFESIDDQPVDLVFALIVPAEAHDEHVKVLGSLAAAFNEESFRSRLRQADSDQTLFEQAIRG
ncbi:PTS IIA-like nitrogen-regulatory protein PtsN [Spongiibacter sp. IMCC21906]|jgi:PTS system nitrogen regulatory IIA component|uniref:PTS sugar transporter subunit IIA n=1 Tax=Spongiibacter sp. IMCC21906 TaxID=1620392 RepID=UPI00062DD481|nr:PTS sugar transporter subunit IIA [Spongiibacter sp. IMCC21906]AKH68857.1 PTS IIA-like nitrogen-regulatory protein PtsN [Spongiibacter sp. IMCC21906]